MMNITKDYQGYRITTNGDVYSLRNPKKKLKLRLKRSGYLYVDIFRYKIWRKYDRKYVHRLVAELFMENPQNLPVVNHKDGDKTNNDISNLEWVSFSENTQHYYKMKYEQSDFGDKPLQTA